MASWQLKIKREKAIIVQIIMRRKDLWRKDLPRDGYSDYITIQRINLSKKKHTKRSTHVLLPTRIENPKRTCK
jgi:hypothetical protein